MQRRRIIHVRLYIVQVTYDLRRNVPGSELTTLAVGGPCREVIDTGSEADLLDALADYPEAVVIGGGSNLLIADEGFDGTLIRAMSSTEDDVVISGDTVDVSATIDWDHLVSTVVAANLQGLEATSGVPGSVGGAIVQNAGAYGQEIADVVVEVRAWDRERQSVVTFTRDECAFAYRTSAFKHDATRRYVITGAKLRFAQQETATPRYGDVSALLAINTGHDGPYALSQIRTAVLEVRTSKGMVLGASDPSAGSFFTNPAVTPEQGQRLESEGLRVIHRNDGVDLVSAAALIEAAGFKRGHQRGQAGLSGKHVLALVNLGGAGTKDIIDLAREVQDAVWQRFEIRLRPEPVMLGFSSSPFPD